MELTSLGRTDKDGLGALEGLGCGHHDTYHLQFLSWGSRPEIGRSPTSNYRYTSVVRFSNLVVIDLCSRVGAWYPFVLRLGSPAPIRQGASHVSETNEAYLFKIP